MQNIFSVLFTESLCTAFFFRHSEIFLASQHYVLVNNVKIIMKIPRNCTWGKCTAADLGYCVPYLTTHKYSGNIYSVVRRNLNKEYVQRVKEQETRDRPKPHLSVIWFLSICDKNQGLDLKSVSSSGKFLVPMSLCLRARAGAKIPGQIPLSRDVPGQNILKISKKKDTRFPV